MKLTREAIQRMISQKQGTSNVTVINQEGGGGGGGVTLGPLLTSLNAEAMPSAEGYLHWTGSAWAFDTPTGGDPVDLTPYALKTWVQTNYASKDDIADFITESQAEDLFAAIDHTHDNYLPLSAGANKALTGSLYITGSNGIQWAGSPGVGMLCYMPSSGWTGISASQWGVGAPSAQGVIRTNANDILHYRNGTNYKIWDAYNFTPSDYLPLTGGTVESLTVTNGLDADAITVGSIVNSDTLAEYLDQDASDARYLQLTGGTMAGPLNMGSYMLSFGTTAAIYYATGLAGNILVLNADNVDIMTAGDNFRWNSQKVATQPWVQQQGYITQTAADGRYIKGVSVYGSSLTPDSNRVVNVPYADINTAGVIQIGTGLVNDNEGHTTVDTSVIASRSWANGQFVTVIGVNGENLTYTKNGSTTNLTVRFAMRTMGFKRMYVTGSQIADANTMTVGGVEYALLSNYASTDLWANMPSGMSYGNVLQLTSASSLSGQLAWDSNDGVTTGVTRKLYWRSRNSTGWGTDDWHTIAFQDWVQSWVNGRGFASNQDLYDLGTLVTTGYLPLTAGSSKPLTGELYISGSHGIQWNNGEGMLVCRPTEGGWTGVSGTQWAVGALTAQGVIRSDANDLLHYRSNTAYKIWDAYNFNPANYLPLFAGSSHPLTDSLYIANNKGLYIKDTNGTGQMAVFVNDSNQFFVGFGMRNAGYTGYFDSNIMHLRSGASGTTMTLDASNRVGIGNTSPAYKLDVSGVIRATDGIMVRNGSSDAIGIDTTGVFFNKAQEGGSPIPASIFSFTWDNDAQNVIVSKNGNMTVTGKLAVGTTTFDGSNAKLQVGGNMFATGSITSKSNAGSVTLGNGNISATNLYISTVVFGNSNNDPAIYIGNGHVYARNSQGQTTMIV